LPHADATGLLLHAADAANDVGHGCQLLAAHGAGFQYLGVSFKRSTMGSAKPAACGAREVFGVVSLQRQRCARAAAAPAPARRGLFAPQALRHASRCASALADPRCA
jgi:hypothetical protein